MAQPTPRSAKFLPFIEDEVPVIDSTESFSDVVAKVSTYIFKAIDAAYTYEQLRTTVAGQGLKPLIASLSEDCHHPAIVAALLTARHAFGSDDGDDADLNESRALACELVAWQFLTYLSEKELIDFLLYELPTREDNRLDSASSSPEGNGNPDLRAATSSEATPLLDSRSSDYNGLGPPKRASFNATDDTQNDMERATSRSKDDLAERFAGMNALEIAAVADAKKFVSQKPVQKIVEDIWNGDVIFWENLSVRAVKKARTYNKRVADPFTRLRVPKYQKAFQAAFFVSFLLLYYMVLVERNPKRITATEVFLYIWIAAFAYDEFGEIQDAGVLFYQTDFWSLWDIAIIFVGAAFFVIRIVGLLKDSDYVIDVAFDVLSMVALFLVPRICSVMSLNPYFGSLIPVLKEMTKAFCKFLPVIIVLYLGFLTTFTMLARDRMTLNEMSWILIKVFFGSSYLGFDVAVKISPLFGYTLMLIFVCLTNILLITSLVSLVSNSLTEVMAHAREEYLFQYSIYVLESSTSRRLTYFMPPLNLFPLLLLRPLRLFFPSDEVRRIRIFVLKATHVPFLALIWAYERTNRLISHHVHPPLAKSPHLNSRPVLSSQFGADSQRDFLKTSPTRTTFSKTPMLSNPRSSSVTAEPANTNLNNAELIGLVQSLAMKVDGLTAMVAGQQRD